MASSTTDPITGRAYLSLCFAAAVVGLFSVVRADAHSGKFIFCEFFDDLNRVEQAILPHGVVALFKQALANLAPLIGGTEYAMTAARKRRCN